MSKNKRSTVVPASIPPLDSNQADRFVGQIQDVLRAYPPPRVMEREHASGSFGEHILNHVHIVQGVLVRLGARYAQIELSHEMQEDVAIIKKIHSIFAPPNSEEGLTDKEVWLVSNPDVVIGWMKPYLQRALEAQERTQ